MFTKEERPQQTLLYILASVYSLIKLLKWVWSLDFKDYEQKSTDLQ